MVKKAGKLKKMRTALTTGIRRGLIISGYLVAQRATRKAPRDTGRLKRSILAGRPYKAGKDRHAIDVGTNVGYAAAQELGSGLFAEFEVPRLIHITPVKKKALAFVWPGAPAHIPVSEKTGKVVLASVWQKGVKPQLYFRPALKDSIDEVKGILLAAMIASLRKM